MKDLIKKKYDYIVSKLNEHLDSAEFNIAERYAYIMMRRTNLFSSVKRANKATVIEQMEAGGIEYFSILAGLTAALSDELSITSYGLDQLAAFEFENHFIIEETDKNVISYVPTSELGATLLVMSEVIGRMFGMVKTTDMSYTKKFQPNWYELLMSSS